MKSIGHRLLVALALVVAGLGAGAEQADLNGTWQLDEDRSQDLAAAGRAFNDERNEQERSRRKQEFDRTSSNNRTRNKFQAAADASEALIREDHRSNVWRVPDDATPIVEAESIRLYVSRKIAVLYDSALKRLLTINPGGRAYSVKGTEITEDALGRTLTYFDDDALVIETDFSVGGRVVERYALAEDGARCVLSLRVQEDARGPWLEFSREYTRAP